MEQFSDWYKPVDSQTQEKAKKIKLLICDIDGVFSDGSIYLGNEGEELKAFNTKDGYGIKALMQRGVEVAVITGRQSAIVEKRMTSLGVKYIYQGMETKAVGLAELTKDLGLTLQEIAFIGDDYPDIPAMQQVGLAVAVADAHPFVKQIAHYVTSTRGGKGAVRELTDLLIASQFGISALTENFSGTSS